MESKAIHITLKKAGPEIDAPPLPAMASEPVFFRGAGSQSLLAPRGVCLSQGHLLVSDTGQNRVFIWKDAARALLAGETPEALVLGQQDESGSGRNAGLGASAATLQYPSGIWTDGRRLIVADAWNHRVLIWLEFPSRDGQAADVVLGQPDFSANQPNVRGIGHAPNERSLNWCYGVWSDGERLWIADTGNRRVLFFNRIPEQSFAPADAVIGKSGFFERDYSHEDAIWPYSVKMGPGGQLAIADTQYYRVLLWHNWQNAFHQPADCLIGQPSFEANGMNQFDLGPRSDTLSWCYDTCFYRDGLFVADTGNSRLLWFGQLPQANGAPADNLIGKPNFFTGSENADTLFGTEKTLYWPFSLSVENDLLALADTGNHRVALYRLNC